MKSYETFGNQQNTERSEMSNQIYTIDQLENLLTPAFERYNVKKAILFGSYAKGEASEDYKRQALSSMKKNDFSFSEKTDILNTEKRSV